VYGDVPPDGVQVTEEGTPTSSVPTGAAHVYVGPAIGVPVRAVACADAVDDALSVTFTWKLNAAVEPSVPETEPVLEFCVMPAGKDPVPTEYVNGDTPPVVVQVDAYVSPTSNVLDGAGQLIVTAAATDPALNACETACGVVALSVSVKV
jgi:hypothetical protein